MRIAAVAVLCVLACGSLAHGQVPVLGIYTDTNGDDCNIVDNYNGLLQTYVVLKDDAGIGFTSVRFAAPLPECFTGSYLSDTNVFPVVIGNSQDGVAVAFGTCRTGTTHILTINMFAQASTPACCQWPIVADPNALSGEVELWDCSILDPQLVSGDVVTSTINGDGSCPCGVQEGLSHPSPPDGSVNQSIYSQLSWSPGYLVGYLYDVNFGTTDPPPLVATGLGGPTYDPGTLDVSTMYYWQIVARQGGDVVEGPVWSFTTQGLGWTMSPPGGAENVSINTMLSWSLTPGTWDSYDVYFGTDPVAIPLVASLDSTAYYPGPLDYSTDYYWKVIAHNSDEDIESPVWMFSTVTLGPANPFPPSGAVDQPVDLILSWDPATGDGPYTYTVLFAPDTLFPDTIATDLTETTIDPGLLEYARFYLWKVNATDEEGGYYPGLGLWNFRTANYVPSNPSPPDSSTGLPFEVDLSWDAPPVDEGFTYYLYYTLTEMATGHVLGSWQYAGWDTTSFHLAAGIGIRVDWHVTGVSAQGRQYPGPQWTFSTSANSAQKLRVPVMVNYCGLITSDTVTVDITIDGNLTPIGAGGVDLTYDSELLSLISCEPGELTADWRYFDYADRDSFIRIGGYDLDYIPPGRVGSFARLTFLSNCCNLDSTRAAVLRLENLTDELATLTPVHGAYRCSYFERDGDVDVSGSVTPGDARCAFRGYLSFPTAPAGNCGQMGWDVRSDVDCSMDITPADALCIFNHWLDASCVFCGESGAPLPSPHPEPLVPAKIAVGEPRFEGTDVVVPILVSSVPMLSAFGFEVDYPAHELEYVAAEPTPATEDFQEIDGIPVADGRIRLGGYGSNPVAAASPTAAVDLRFKLLTSRPSGAIVIDSFVDDVRSAWTVRWSFPNAPGKKTHQDITLLSNYPNPFNPVTVIRYEIPAALGSVHIKLAIFNVEGKLVRNLVDETKSPGAHQAEWDAHSDRGEAVASGIYFYVLQVGKQTFKKKMVLLK